jgi:hypothetical protein
MKFFSILVLLISCTAFAESSKLIKVDLDVATTEIVSAELGQWKLYYWIDKSTCICGVINGNSQGVAVVDCNKLKLNTKLAVHLTQCN